MLNRKKKSFPWLLLVIIAGLASGIGFYLFRMMKPTFGRSGYVVEWIRDPASHLEWKSKAGTRCSPEAPFVMPTDGLIGYLWDDSFKAGHRHQGIDIFGGMEPGRTPVVAAYNGYLTRLSNWKSALIIRIPSDPLQPGRQIWLYYTHMADAMGNSYISNEFPPGTSDRYVEVGTLLGFQGNYNGDGVNPTGVHLHFSIVRDDGNGQFLNELEIRNTLDPSPYLGLPLNARTSNGEVVVCSGAGQ